MNRVNIREYLPTILSLLLLLLNIVTIAQEETNTPEAVETQRESIFSYDNCTPPCWFGLLPGESSSQEVLEFLVSSELVFEPRIYENGRWIAIDIDTAPLFNGRYIFSMRPSERTLCCGVYSHTEINEGILDRIHITVRENITFNEVITNMNWPDEIRLSRFVTLSAQSAFTLEFIYYELYIRLTIAPEDYDSEPKLCHLSVLSDNFLVSSVTYYSQRNAMELVDTYLPGGQTEQQPTLLAYQLESRHIPNELWTVLMGDEPFDCQELWESLPEERILPDWWDDNDEGNNKR